MGNLPKRKRKIPPEVKRAKKKLRKVGFRL